MPNNLYSKVTIHATAPFTASPTISPNETASGGVDHFAFTGTMTANFTPRYVRGQYTQAGQYLVLAFSPGNYDLLGSGGTATSTQTFLYVEPWSTTGTASTTTTYTFTSNTSTNTLPAQTHEWVYKLASATNTATLVRHAINDGPSPILIGLLNGIWAPSE